MQDSKFYSGHLLIVLHVKYLDIITLPSIVLGECYSSSYPFCPALVGGVRQVQLDNTHGHDSVFSMWPPLIKVIKFYYLPCPNYETYWIKSLIFLFSSFVSNWLDAFASILASNFWNICMLTASTLTVMHALMLDLANLLCIISGGVSVICNIQGGHSYYLTTSSLHDSQLFVNW